MELNLEDGGPNGNGMTRQLEEAVIGEDLVFLRYLALSPEFGSEKYYYFWFAQDADTGNLRYAHSSFSAHAGFVPTYEAVLELFDPSPGWTEFSPCGT